MLPGRDKPISPGDIMILLPRREPFGGEVIRQLKLRHIPVAGADRIVLTEQIAVMDLMALGRFVLQRDDDLNLAALLRSPLCGLTEEELFTLCHERRGTVWQALGERKDELHFAAAHIFLSEMLARADYAPPFEFYSHALVARGKKRELIARLGPESQDAIEEFLSLALAHERRATPSLEGFLDWVARGNTESEARHGAGPRRSPGDDGAWRQGPGGRHRHPSRHHHPARSAVAQGPSSLPG